MAIIVGKEMDEFFLRRWDIWGELESYSIVAENLCLLCAAPRRFPKSLACLVSFCFELQTELRANKDFPLHVDKFCHSFSNRRLLNADERIGFYLGTDCRFPLGSASSLKRKIFTSWDEPNGYFNNKVSRMYTNCFRNLETLSGEILFILPLEF